MTTTWSPITKASTPANWINVPKAAVPANTTITTGTPIGLLLALTYSTTATIGGWKNVSKSVTPNSWTNVAKAT